MYDCFNNIPVPVVPIYRSNMKYRIVQIFGLVESWIRFWRITSAFKKIKIFNYRCRYFFIVNMCKCVLQVCCDCSHPDPQWASINFGITLCIECGGIHRQVLIQHNSQIMLKLASWKTCRIFFFIECCSTENQCYGSKYMEFGSGILVQFGSGSSFMLSILKEKFKK